MRIILEDSGSICADCDVVEFAICCIKSKMINVCIANDNMIFGFVIASRLGYIDKKNLVFEYGDTKFYLDDNFSFDEFYNNENLTGFMRADFDLMMMALYPEDGCKNPDRFLCKEDSDKIKAMSKEG